MCQWTNILTIEDDSHTPRHMIMHHGSLTQDNVNVGVPNEELMLPNLNLRRLAT